MDNVIKCTINIIWDNEASVYIATSDDVPGLVLESGSFDGLLERVRYAVPELLSLTSLRPEIIDYSYVTNRNDRIPVYG